MNIKDKLLKLVSRKLGVVGTAMVILATIPTPDPVTNIIKVAGLVALPIAYVVAQAVQNGMAEKARLKSESPNKESN